MSNNQYVTLVDSDLTGLEAHKNTSLNVDFTRIAYPLSVVGTPVNCSVTPSTITATDNTFTATFSGIEKGDNFSFVLTNSGPDFGTDSDANFVNFNDGTNTSGSSTITYGTDWGYVDANIYSSSTIFGHTVGYSRPITSYSSSNIIWTSTGGPYEKAETRVQQNSSLVDREINLEIFTRWNTATTHRRLNRGYVYSPEFTGESGDYITYTGNVQTVANNDKCVVWALNIGTGDWVEIQSDTFSGTRETLPANGTYRIIVFLYQYIDSSNRTQVYTFHTIKDFTRFNSAGVTKTELTVSGVGVIDPTEIIEAATVQEVGDSLINLYELTLPPGTTEETLYFHDGLNFDTGAGKNIYFANKQGTTLNEYLAFPITVTGIETKSGADNRPTLSMANLTKLGRVLVNNSDGTDDETTLQTLLTENNLNRGLDLLGSSLTVRSTLLKYTYASTDSATVPIEYPSFTYILDRVSGEEAIELQIELSSPIDVQDANIPARIATGRYCSWEYQGGALYQRGGCSVNGNSFYRFFDENDALITANITKSTGTNVIPLYSPTSSYALGDKVRIEPVAGKGWRIFQALNTVPVGVRPHLSTYYWKRIDICGKRLSSCKLRFQGIQSALQADSDTLAGTVPDRTYLNSSRSLPFGGFPGARDAETNG